MQDTQAGRTPGTGDKGLKSNAIGFLDTLIIGHATSFVVYER